MENNDFEMPVATLDVANNTADVPITSSSSTFCVCLLGRYFPD